MTTRGRGRPRGRKSNLSRDIKSDLIEKAMIVSSLQEQKDVDDTLALLKDTVNHRLVFVVKEELQN